MLGNQHDAIDLMQEVFMSVYRSLESFRFDSSFNTWLIRLAQLSYVEIYQNNSA